jgi:hypothetical protein
MTHITPERIDTLWKQAFDNTEAGGKTSHRFAALLFAEPAPVQEPVAHQIIAGALFDFMGFLTSRNERLMLSSADNASPVVEAITNFAKMRGLSLDDARVEDWQDTTPPAAAVQEGRDWSLLEATQESLREHMAEIKRLKEAQPAVPDAMTSADIQEHIEYLAGWNDCRAEMLKGMK